MKCERQFPFFIACGVVLFLYAKSMRELDHLTLFDPPI